MSVFKIPANFCDELRSMMSHFWWNHEEGKRGISWVTWKKLCQPKGMGGMGFRDFKLFNLALLGKQAWRLTTEAGSLWEQVMRARYYPNGDFMMATLGHNPSYIWRGLVEARMVLDRGMRRRIGDGISTKVWRDAWLPGTHTGRVISPCAAGNEEMFVSELLTAGNGWDMELITSVFLPFEMDRIVNIRKVWEGLGLEGEEGEGGGCISDWVEEWWRELGVREHSVFMVGCWALWEHRNNVIFESSEVDPWVVIRRVGDVVAEMEGSAYEVIKGRRRKDMGSGSDGPRGWEPAPRGFVKVNVDAGVKEDEGVSLGLVCRGEMGDVLWGVFTVQDQVLEPHVAEAVAILEGLKEALRTGYRDVVLESDCLQVVEALKKKLSGRSCFMLVIEEILLLCNSFNTVLWSFSSRVNNTVAHALAHIYPRNTGRMEWSETLPPSANDAILFDLSLLK
ncbi:uncharacterized protein LOC141617506 [Silene latifolia]|uniref:uncharacterized protein LOC141617506 n=1 Tax=Silene latifolia TaxID=37657 RepID=UPI003D7758D0